MPDEFADQNDQISWRQLANNVLSASETPLTIRQIWDIAIEKGLNRKLAVWDDSSPLFRPLATLSTVVLNEVNAENSLYVRVGEYRPMRVMLRSKWELRSPDQQLETEKELRATQEELEENNSENIQDFDIQSIGEENIDAELSAKYERSLHAYLCYFAKNRFKVSCKTINHLKALKKNAYKKWKNPDILGCSIPSGGYCPPTIAFGRVNGADFAKIYSFELKISINNGNLAQSFFQTVSNSCWANYAYLVTSKIVSEPEDGVWQELERLSSVFGVGVILLDIKDPDNSQVLLPAKMRSEIDWKQFNDLIDSNKDAKDFTTGATLLVENTNPILERAYLQVEEYFDKVLDADGVIAQFKDYQNS